MSAFVELTVITIGISLIIMLMYRFLTKPEEIRKIKNEIKHYKELMNKAHKNGDVKGAQKYMSEMMKLNNEHLRHNMKPMLLSMIFVVVVLGYVSKAYSDVVVTLPFALPFFGREMGWFWWYIIVSITSTLVFRRMLGVE